MRDKTRKQELIANAFSILKEAIKNDAGYAWGWHCNIAVCSQDEGMEHAASNRAASRFMKLCFDTETGEEIAYEKETIDQTTSSKI